MQNRKILDLKRLHGVFPVYKPKHITSAQYLEKIKHALSEAVGGTVGIKEIKLGHSGTLDSTATGVLVVGINSGCSRLPCFLEGQKSYTTEAEFGRATDTYNDVGKIIVEKPFEHITAALLDGILHRFKGQILQKPPAYSALKLNGKRYSDLAKTGAELELKPRPVTCYDLKLVNFNLPRFQLELTCGKGFYVRSLVHDLGIMLKSCAHLIELERTRQGPFSLADCLREHQLSPSSISDSINKNEALVQQYCRQQIRAYKEKTKQWDYRE